jgi:hypothetical protein
MSRNPTKRTEPTKALRVMISIPRDWKTEGARQAKARKLSFSGYLRALIYAEASPSVRARLSEPLSEGAQPSARQKKSNAARTRKLRVALG